MGKITVTFQPESTRTEAQSGDTLLEVASYAGIDISNLCGGQGVCGRCRVKIKQGRVSLTGKVIGKLSHKEIEQGYTLACQAELSEDDVEVWIPPESRTDVQIQISDYIVSFAEPTHAIRPGLRTPTNSQATVSKVLSPVAGANTWRQPFRPGPHLSGNQEDDPAISPHPGAFFMPVGPGCSAAQKQVGNNGDCAFP